jgi:hypothetical protein
MDILDKSFQKRWVFIYVLINLNLDPKHRRRKKDPNTVLQKREVHLTPWSALAETSKYNTPYKSEEDICLDEFS